MLAGVCVLAGVAIGRAIAAQRAAASLAGSQMDPLVADLDALFAFASLGVFDGGDGFDLGTNVVGHLLTLSWWFDGRGAVDSSFCKKGVNGSDDLRSFADGRGNPFD